MTYGNDCGCPTSEDDRAQEIERMKAPLCDVHRNDLPHCSGCVICGLQKTAQERNAAQLIITRLTRELADARENRMAFDMAIAKARNVTNSST
jgi:hypothetical protein